MIISRFQDKRPTIELQTKKNQKETPHGHNESLVNPTKNYCPFQAAIDCESNKSKKHCALNNEAASKQSLNSEDNKNSIKSGTSISGLSNLTIQLKVESCDSSPRKSLKVRPDSIKPLILKHDNGKSNSLKNAKICISIDQEAIQRPYNQEHFSKIEYQDLPIKKKLNYWRSKKIEQYKIAKNISSKTSPIGSPRKKSEVLKPEKIFRTFEEATQDWLPNTLKETLSQTNKKKTKKKFLGEFLKGKTKKNTQFLKQVPSGFSLRATPIFERVFQQKLIK